MEICVVMCGMLDPKSVIFFYHLKRLCRLLVKQVFVVMNA